MSPSNIIKMIQSETISKLTDGPELFNKVFLIPSNLILLYHPKFLKCTAWIFIIKCIGFVPLNPLDQGTLVAQGGQCLLVVLLGPANHLHLVNLKYISNDFYLLCIPNSDIKDLLFYTLFFRDGDLDL